MIGVKRQAFVTRRTFIASSLASATLLSSRYGHADEALNSLKVMTEDYPPFNYHKDGELKGLSVEIVSELLKRAGTTHKRSDIELLPWARGYNLTLDRPGHALFSTTRTEDRENLFKWVGPFVPTIIGLIARKDRNLTIGSEQDFSKIRIGVVKDDVGHLLLRSAGVADKDLDIVLFNDQNYKKLAAGRIDAMAYETSVMKWGLHSVGESLSEYEVIHELKRSDLYLALNKETPDSQVETLQRSFDSLVADGTHAEIVARYLS